MHVHEHVRACMRVCVGVYVVYVYVEGVGVCVEGMVCVEGVCMCVVEGGEVKGKRIFNSQSAAFWLVCTE